MKLFPTEAALCAAFIGAVDKRSWVAYAETAGWDILLVRKTDGFQIGIQAKLKFNVDVVTQALEDGYTYAIKGPGPDCRAVLVPEDDVQRGIGKICKYLGVTVVRMRNLTGLDVRYNSMFSPYLPDKDGWLAQDDWHELAPLTRCTLPEYVPDVVAGSPSPIQLTEWKIKALKLAVLIEERGFVTRADFAHLSLDHRRWVTLGWLKITEGKFLPDGGPNFKAQHPIVYEKIKADKRWRKGSQDALI